MKDIFSLKNKVAVVTGGSMGIGAMIAEGFLNFGAKVYLVARNAEQLKAKQEELSKLGECEIISADLKDIAGIKQLVSQFAEKESRLDILVNNNILPFIIVINFIIHRLIPNSETLLSYSLHVAYIL